MSRLAGSLWTWSALVVIGFVGVFVCEPHYVSLQTTPGAHELLRRVGDHSGRDIAAALFDCVFAVAYGVLGVRVLRRIGQGRAPAVVAMMLIVVGAVCDLVENVLLVRNIAVGSRVGNDAVAVMQIFGGPKWLALVGYLVLAVIGLLWLQGGMRERRLARLGRAHDDVVGPLAEPRD